MKSGIARKLAVAALASVLAAGLGWIVLARLRARLKPPATVQLVDARASLKELLDARVSLPRPKPPGGHVLTLDPIDEDTARRFFPALDAGRGNILFDPLVYMTRSGPQSNFNVLDEHPRGGWRSTSNSRGMREDREIDVHKRGLRVLVTGDSHTDGVCDNSDSFVHVLEREWSYCHPDTPLEALNSGMGGYNSYNYLGVIERHADLAPDVYIVVVYGGNDFVGMMPLQRYFERRGNMEAGRTWIGRLPNEHPELLGPIAQELHQTEYFASNPEDVAECIETMKAISLEIQRRAAARGCRALLVYLPPAFVVQRRFFEDALARAREFAEFSEADISVSERIADAWLAFLCEREIPALDLRPHFRAARESWYWRADHHVNLVGHEAIGQLLALEVDALLR